MQPHIAKSITNYQRSLAKRRIALQPVCFIPKQGKPANMFQFRLPSLPDFSSWGATAINLPKVQVHDVEERPEKRARALKHLIKANHINNSVLYHNLTFHNHNPHILGSAYILGADSDELNTIYEQETASLERWQDSPGEIAKHDWRDNLGKPESVLVHIILNAADRAV